jgi:F-type H+-transporting ATPase subunit beta
MPDSVTAGALENVGSVVAVRGSVVDVRFTAQLPKVYALLHAGRDSRVVMEVLAQVSGDTVRAIALTPTQGLARGTPVTDSGGPLKAPVGKGIVARMFDVFGNAIDGGAPPAPVRWRSVHPDPPSLAQRSTQSEIVETGIKVIDVLVPLDAAWRRCSARRRTSTTCSRA